MCQIIFRLLEENRLKFDDRYMTNHGVKLATFGNTTKGARHMQGYIVVKRYRLGQITITFFYGLSQHF